MDVWAGATIHTATYNGKTVTVKVARDGRQALVAEGDVADIQPPSKGGVDHVHIWDLSSGDFHLHDLRLSRSALFPHLRDDEKSGDRDALRARDRAQAELVRRAQALAVGPIDGRTVTAAKALQEEFKDSGKPSAGTYQAFRAAMDAIFEGARQARERREGEWAGNKSAKEALVREAESVALSADMKTGADRMRTLKDRWNTIGPCEKTDHDRLWAQFRAAQTKLQERRQREWSTNRAAKEAIVREADSVAASSDTKAAGDRLVVLSQRWKSIGPCERADNDRLWSQFSSAQAKLRDRKQKEFDQRKQQWESNRNSKQRLVSQMSSLSSSSDFKAAKDRARTLSEEWRAVGPCEKSDNERLYNEFKTAKDRLFEAAKRDGERRRAEARQRAQERVYQLEEQLRNCEVGIIHANESRTPDIVVGC